MLPHGHLAAGYLVYGAVTRRFPGADGRTELLLLVLATQAPDIVDKPLGLVVGGPFDGGRTVGHSLLFALPVVGVLYVLVSRNVVERRPALALAVGYLTHPFGDAAPLLVQGDVTTDLREVSFLFWPVGIPAPEVVALLTAIPVLGDAVAGKAAWAAANLPRLPALTVWLRGTELLLSALAVVLWVRDGAPGVQSVEVADAGER